MIVQNDSVTMTLRQRRRAWIFSRLLAAQSVDGELARLEGADRALAARLATASTEDRQSLWAEHLKGLEKSDADALVRQVFAADPLGSDPDRLPTVGDLAKLLPEIEWLWRDWIPRGMLSLLVAPPGLGKSAVALAGIAGPVIKPGHWPDGTIGPSKVGTVLWCDTESTQPLLVARAIMWGLPAERVILPRADPMASVRLDDPVAFDELRDAVRIHRPDIVVIDSLRGAHRGDENSSAMMEVMGRLADLARDFALPLLAIHHTRKRNMLDESAAVSLERVHGSSAIGAMARSVLALDQPNPAVQWLRLSVIKSNVCRPPDPIGVLVSKDEVKFGEAPEAPEKRNKLEAAIEWLRAELTSGPKKATDVEIGADKQGIAERTLRRAKTAIGVDSDKTEAGWVWSIGNMQPAKEATESPS